MNDTPRYCLDCDESGHWYCIPVELRDEFDALSARLENSDGEDADAWRRWNELGFDAMRLPMHVCNYSFTDWKEYA